MKKKRKYWRGVLYGAILLVNGLILSIWVRRLTLGAGEKTQQTYFDQQTIAQYDGTDPNKPVYLAMDGFVYDVSGGREDFYAPGRPYHYLAGKDSSALLHLAGGTIIKTKYPVVGKYR